MGCVYSWDPMRKHSFANRSKCSPYTRKGKMDTENNKREPLLQACWMFFEHTYLLLVKVFTVDDELFVRLQPRQLLFGLLYSPTHGFCCLQHE